ncbi:hypothetical protein GCM10007415_23230 [Parapedobacter pyrenivorans]|uniref:Uncharacterized protein n=2 Tax=Parapedobacter pyrenivorans TaxID=1305674 RepID=A0A917HRX0_9SPHI|nr:hypothetical protein GCM10007415_23230 [Parapedobacter pyrenivorans]
MPFFLLATEKPVKVLLIDGFSNHNWQLNNALIMIRALYWLATKKDDLPVPVDFPTENTISLRPDFK